VRHIGVTGGKISAISETPLTGDKVVDVAGHVVSPGFIDLHAHGQTTGVPPSTARCLWHAQ
jgi:N-acyl-D-glutamate deacylase